MTKPDKRNLAWIIISGVVLVLIGWPMFLISCGCASSTPPNDAGNTIPNFVLVEPGIARGGQPRSDSDWAWLVAHGYTNDIKLNTGSEGRDSGAIAHGMRLYYHPVDTLQELDEGPNDSDFKQAVREIVPGTFVHCEHGQDRTGLLVGCYRLAEGTNKAAAWQEMTNHGYHPALQGLTRYWWKQ